MRERSGTPPLEFCCQRPVSNRSNALCKRFVSHYDGVVGCSIARHSASDTFSIAKVAIIWNRYILKFLLCRSLCSDLALSLSAFSAVQLSAFHLQVLLARCRTGDA